MTRAERCQAVCAELARLMGDERKRLRLSKNQLACLTGLNQSTVSRLENHPENPTFASLLLVADSLNLDLSQLVRQAIHNIDAAAPQPQLRRFPPAPGLRPPQP